MKHIKLFEGFNTDDYFQHIDNDDWWDNREIRIEMSSRTIEVISGLFSNWDIEVDDNKDMISVQAIKNYEYVIKVYEVDDEYFYVEVTRSYPNGGTFCYCYRCDQLEGLIQFLKNENII